MQACHHLIVGEADNADLVLPERFIPLHIIINLAPMNLSINLNYQFCAMAIEVGDESPNDLLTSKVKAVDLIPAYCLPHLAFRRGHAPAEFFCQPDFDRVNRLPDNDGLGSSHG